MDATGPIALVGNSVRYLAQSARSAGAQVLAVDAFADQDTLQASVAHRRASSASPRALLQACRSIVHARPGKCSSWLYGAGFESDPDALLALATRKHGGLGNDPAVLHLLAEPQRWFSLLRELGIAFPEVAFGAPPAKSGWLFKPNSGYGGLGVRRVEDVCDHLCEGYFQRFINAPLCSLVFAADGTDLEIIGFNRLLARYPAAGDFRFAGAISGLVPAQEAQDVMLTAARLLTRSLGLRGVNGLDFVMRRGEPLLLELNARPPATLELYEGSLPRGGFLCHVDGCRGRLTAVSNAESVRGLRLFYARRTQHVAEIDWPAWVTDRPAVGEQVLADQPLCTVHADGPDAVTVAALLRQKLDAVDLLLNGLVEKAT